MEEKTNVDQVRRAALDRIRRSEKSDRFWSVLVVWSVYCTLLVAFYLLADFSNRLHVLLLIASLAILTMLFGGVMALEKHIERNVQLILKSIELIDSRQSSDFSETLDPKNRMP